MIYTRKINCHTNKTAENHDRDVHTLSLLIIIYEFEVYFRLIVEKDFQTNTEIKRQLYKMKHFNFLKHLTLLITSLRLEYHIVLSEVIEPCDLEALTILFAESGQCTSVHPNVNAQMVMQEPEILELANISMFNVLTTLETQLFNCRLQLDDEKFPKIGFDVKSQIIHINNQKTCRQINCPRNWLRALFDWITHGTYANRCISKRKFELTLNYTFGECAASFFAPVPLTVDTDFNREQLMQQYHTYNEKITKLIDLLSSLSDISLPDTEKYELLKETTNCVKELKSSSRYKEHFQHCLANQHIFPKALGKGSSGEVYRAGRNSRSVRVFKAMFVDMNKLTYDTDYQEIIQKNFQYMVYVSDSLGTCGKNTINQFDAKLYSSMIKSDDSSYVTGIMSYGKFVRKFENVHLFIPLTTIPYGYEPIKSETEIAKTLSIKQKVDVAIQFLQALKCMHDQNIIHRDIKPANVIVSKKSKGYVKVSSMQNSRSHVHENSNSNSDSDFHVFLVDIDGALHLKNNADDDFADPLSPKHKKKARSEMIGTPVFMPPEIIKQHKEKVGKGSDIWSTGFMFYSWIVAGQLKFLYTGETFIAALWWQKVATIPNNTSGIELFQSANTIVKTQIDGLDENLKQHHQQWYNQVMKILIQMTNSDSDKRPNVDQLIQTWTETYQLI